MPGERSDRSEDRSSREDSPTPDGGLKFRPLLRELAEMVSDVKTSNVIMTQQLERITRLVEGEGENRSLQERLVLLEDQVRRQGEITSRILWTGIPSIIMMLISIVGFFINITLFKGK